MDLDPVQYRVIRSARRTAAIEITPEGEVLVRAPRAMTDEQIRDMIARHRDWLAAHLARARERAERRPPEPTEAEREACIRRALELLPRRVAHYSAVMGLQPMGVTVTGARKRFGSCSGKDRICFSWRLMLYPPEAIDYVVVHELAHIRHKNHSKAFYDLVASVLPDYREREALLR
jgi:predicted metal-dependent hydrolase